jgi:type II secretory pathway pseudopilin PulG
MATSLAKATELGFAEFASTLISETLNAIVTSILTQEKQAAQLEQQAQLSIEEYAAENLTDEIVRAEVIRLFPSSIGAVDKSSVDAGEPYSRETEERPNIYNKTGYKISKGDLTVNQGKAVIGSVGYTHIFAATKVVLAKQHLSILKTVVARGIPRVIVDNGHITSKLTLRVEADTTTTSSTTGSKIAGTGIRKLFAQPVNPNRPEYLTLKADVLSEVEITFKTVVP